MGHNTCKSMGRVLRDVFKHCPIPPPTFKCCSCSCFMCIGIKMFALWYNLYQRFKSCKNVGVKGLKYIMA